MVWDRARPMVLGLMITDRCNLSCFYCGSHDGSAPPFTWDRVRSLLSDAFRRGCRVLVFTGGEPMMWRDGERALRHVVDFAYELGFIDVFVFTNGTFPLDIARCRFFVTIEGPKAAHEKVRPDSYARIQENVRATQNRDIYASITFHHANTDSLEDLVGEVCSSGLFKGISFNFLTAEPALVERVGIPLAERGAVLDRLWRLKKDGYPIMLSRAAMEALRGNGWRRPLPQIEFATSQKTYPCCRDVGNPGICALCGYSTCVELSQLMAFKPSAVWEAFRSARQAA